MEKKKKTNTTSYKFTSKIKIDMTKTYLVDTVVWVILEEFKFKLSNTQHLQQLELCESVPLIYVFCVIVLFCKLRKAQVFGQRRMNPKPTIPWFFFAVFCRCSPSSRLGVLMPLVQVSARNSESKLLFTKGETKLDRRMQKKKAFLQGKLSLLLLHFF